MRSEKSNRTWRPGASVFLVGCLLLWSSCVRFRSQIFSDISLDIKVREAAYPKKETIERLLVNIWDSGFLIRDEVIHGEITNNAYGIFSRSNPLSSQATGRASFTKETGKRDEIVLNKRMFAQVKIDIDKGAYISNLDSNIEATLVHELFHDFWYNVLTSADRSAFSDEAHSFYERLVSAVSPEEQLDFLSDLGISQPSHFDFASYEQLRILHSQYPQDKFFGTEMFAILAELTYAGEAIIPSAFRDFYRGLISDKVLDGGLE